MHNKVPKNEYLKGKPGKKQNPYKKDVIYDPRGQWAYPGEITRIPSGDITMQGVPYPVLGVDNLGYEQMMYPGLNYQFPGNTVTEYPQNKVFETEADFYRDALIRKRNQYWNMPSSGSGVAWPTDNMPTKSGPGPIQWPTIKSDYQGIAMMYGGDPSIPELTQAKKGGWLNKYSKMPKKTSSKNIKTSINKLMVKNPLFERNYMLYGAKGPRHYDPNSKYQTGGSRAPIVVFDKNDPRLQAYNDSLMLYNQGINFANVIKNSGYYHSVPEHEHIKITDNQKYKTYPFGNIQGQGLGKFIDDTGKSYEIIDNKKIQPIENLIFTRKESDYKTRKEARDAALNNEFLKNDISWFGHGVQQYKKPVQPIVVGTTPASPTPKPPTPKPPTPASPAAQPKASTPVEQPKPTEPSTKYSYMPTNWGPTYYYEWDSQQKKWIPISQQSYNYNTEGGTKNTQLYSSTPPGFKYGGWLDSYQGGGVTINSEADYQKSLLMKNKTKERMDAERAWAAKKVAAANKAKTQQTVNTSSQQQAALFGIQPVAAESTGVNKIPQAGLDYKNEVAQSFHKAVDNKMKEKPNFTREQAQTQVNIENDYAQGRTKGQGSIRQADPEQGLLSKTIEVAAHPFNALDAYVQSGYVPDYFSHNKDAVNPMDMAYSFTPAGWYTTGAHALYNELPNDVAQGNWLGVVEDILMGLPLAGKIGSKALGATSKYWSPNLNTAVDEGFSNFARYSGESGVPTQLPGSPNVAPQQMGLSNPLAIADQIIPRPPSPGLLLGMEDSWNYWSPLNYIPGYGKKLIAAESSYPNFVGFRKFGNSLDDVIESQSLRPKGTGIGSKQIKQEGNWAEPGKVNENYPGVFEATMNPQIPGSNIKLEKWNKRNGIVGTTKEGNVAIPLTDPGLSFNRRLPFSSRYIPINKQKLINNQFQLATQLPHVQSLVEKYGLYAGLALVSGYMMGGKEQALKNLETVNKYSIDPVINWTKKQWNEFDKLINPSVEQKKTGGTSRKSNNWLNSYQGGGSYADSLALYNLSQAQVNAIKKDPNLISSSRQVGSTGAPGRAVQSSSAYRKLSTNPSIYTYAPGISTNPYSSYYHPTILPTGDFKYNIGTVPSGELVIPTYKKPVGSVAKSAPVETPAQTARELKPIESKLTPIDVSPEPALYKAPKAQPLYKMTQEPNMPTFYWQFDPVAKQWYQISAQAYSNAPANKKKMGGASRKSGEKLVNYSQKPNFVKTQSTNWLDKY